MRRSGVGVFLLGSESSGLAQVSLPSEGKAWPEPRGPLLRPPRPPAFHGQGKYHNKQTKATNQKPPTKSGREENGQTLLDKEERKRGRGGREEAMQTGNFLEKLWTRPPDPEHLRLLLPWLLPDASLEALPGKAFKNLN